MHHSLEFTLNSSVLNPCLFRGHTCFQFTHSISARVEISMRPLAQKNMKNQHSLRRGLMMTELIVAATLLITALSLVVTLSFRTGKLWQDSRHYKLAVEELTNQLERLTILDEAELDAALDELAVSEKMQTMLPRPRLSGTKLADENGTRVVLNIQWDRVGKAKPLTLVGWLVPAKEEQP